MTLEATYVLPVRWAKPEDSPGITGYLRWLSELCDVIVVDGSPLDVFERHSELWSGFVKHVRPDPDLTFVNGKVNGVTTGIRAAGTDRVVVADDDIRFSKVSLARTVELLGGHELVIATSFFRPTPWHAQWDESRILLNRAFGVHFPAAVGLSRSLFLKAGGYSGDVLFENLELIRTMRYAGARLAQPNDLFVEHLPPERSAFWSQRVRQAYDDFTLPARMGLWLSLAPATLWALRRRKPEAIAAAGLASVLVAERGRRRGGGTDVYPGSASWFAPLWLLERALCSWAALWYRVVRGGVPYRDGVIRNAATPRKKLRADIRRRVRPDRGQ